MRRVITCLILLAGLTASVVTLQPPSAITARSQKKPAPTQAIDINRAGTEDFERLPGIGPALAREIVEYRTKHGPFRRVEDLLALKRIGYKKWKAIRPYLTVDQQ